MSGYTFSGHARRDLDDIFDYIAKSSPAAALHFVDRVEARCNSIAASPGIGRMRDDLRPGLRSLPFGNYLIFYRPLAHGVEIVRVLSGYRDIEVEFGW